MLSFVEKFNAIVNNTDMLIWILHRDKFVGTEKWFKTC
jgi:hypothetical protein